MIFAIDFDGTIVKHDFPRIGENVPYAFETLKEWTLSGHKLILWTIRDGINLDAAIKHCGNNGVNFWAININPQQFHNTSSKIYSSIIIDDLAVGCPLIYPGNNLKPFADWKKIKEIVDEKIKRI